MHYALTALFKIHFPYYNRVLCNIYNIFTLLYFNIKAIFSIILTKVIETKKKRGGGEFTNRPFV